ncbi:unnamed protein product (macronuclear) [Paramecium tetraurelia]|uniref:Fcf2 pre-rRNA processing C-terminal domain-containing protein n=1 Tax=Paramecium tetraurelia TaxID=5888 RepID=A0DPZ2_PARTE|nr:uncharacterized protein GSPATT00002508001 [Paramecium tetraurelia]CAK85109.1 unnamed protein product [Paramecium tetraurelia]|eukprot:XP_001452506.1 hypothetical protein (macronuclear) [Paramecium tetraurelia strain d4-2]
MKQYQVNQNNDPNFDLLPIQPTYKQELDKEVQKLEQQSLFADSIDVDIPCLKKNREEKRLRKMAKMSQLTEGWFGMKSQDQDETMKQEFLILKLKKYLDPKQPVKSSDFKTMPKYYQVGTYIDGMDNYNIKKKKKNQSDLIDQFLEQDQEKQTTKNSFQKIQQRQQRISKVNSKLRKLKRMAKSLGRKNK